MYDNIFAELLSLLGALEHVRQSPRHHPEGAALFHSLQVFDQARRESDDPVHWAAALLHDVGKAVHGGCHAIEGARLLDGMVNGRVEWLVAHHLDLLHSPRQTRANLAGDSRLAELAWLRRWDLAGRDPQAIAPAAERALGALLEPGVAEAWLCPAHILEDDLSLTA